MNNDSGKERQLASFAKVSFFILGAAPVVIYFFIILLSVSFSAAIFDSQPSWNTFSTWLGCLTYIFALTCFVSFESGKRALTPGLFWLSAALIIAGPLAAVKVFGVIAPPQVKIPSDALLGGILIGVLSFLFGGVSVVLIEVSSFFRQRKQEVALFLLGLTIGVFFLIPFSWIGLNIMRDAEISRRENLNKAVINEARGLAATMCQQINSINTLIHETDNRIFDQKDDEGEKKLHLNYPVLIYSSDHNHIENNILFKLPLYDIGRPIPKNAVEMASDISGMGGNTRISSECPSCITATLTKLCPYSDFRIHDRDKKLMPQTGVQPSYEMPFVLEADKIQTIIRLHTISQRKVGYYAGGRDLTDAYATVIEALVIAHPSGELLARKEFEGNPPFNGPIENKDHLELDGFTDAASKAHAWLNTIFGLNSDYDWNPLH